MASMLQYNNGVAGLKLHINKQQFRIGRANHNEICIDNELVSTEHAVIEAVEGISKAGVVDYYIKDLNSTNTTIVNDSIISLYKLSHGDIVSIGTHTFKFLSDESDELAETLKLHKSWFPGLYYASKKKKSRKKNTSKKRK